MQATEAPGTVKNRTGIRSGKRTHIQFIRREPTPSALAGVRPTEDGARTYHDVVKAKVGGSPAHELLEGALGTLEPAPARVGHAQEAPACGGRVYMW